MKQNYFLRMMNFSSYGTRTSYPLSLLKTFLFLLVITLPSVGLAGTINMKNGIVTTTCSDYFYDSGGSSSTYGTSENKVITIYPATPGAKVTVNFTSFDVEDGWDYLYVYDGSSTSASYVGAYTGYTGPGSVTSTAASGALTFQFISDSYYETDGWVATVSCGSLSACSGAISAGTAIGSATSLCSGIPFTLTLSGFTAASGITYQWQQSTTGTGGWTNISGATTMPYTFTPATGTWYFRCNTTCTASSTTATSTVVTATVGGSSLPYLEDFESTSAGSFPSCTYATYASPWGDGMEVRDYGSYPSSLDNHTSGGSHYLYAGYYTGMYDPDYFFTPGFNLTTGKTYQFSFWYNTDGYGPYTMGAYIGNDQTKASMTTALGADIYPNNTSYQQYVANFTVSTAGSYFIGIKISETTWWYGTVIDDIGLMELPPCTGTPAYAGKANLSPKMVCSSPGATTLSVTGTPAVSGLTFQWYESSTLTGTYTLISGATTNPYTRTGISSSMYYFCKIGCSAGGSTKNTDTVNVKIAPLNPPYVEDFETGTKGVNMPCASYTYSWDAYSYWYLHDGAHPYSWTGLDNHTTGGTKWLFAGGGLGYYSSGEYWFSPAINFTSGKAYNISYWYNTDGYDSYLFGARVGSSQSASAMTKVVGADVTSSTTSYTKFSGDFVAGSTGPQYIGIKFKASNWWYGAAIDDIGLTQLPPCSAKPTAGNAKATPSMICSASGGSTSLTLIGLSAASDLTYQWQSSSSGLPGTFTNISGATSLDYTTGMITTPTCFRCVVKCPLIGGTNTDTSSVTCVSVGPLTPPYLETFETAAVGVNQPCASYTYDWDAGGGTDYFYYWGIKDKPGTYYTGMDNHTTGGSKYLSTGYYVGSYALGTPTGNQQYWFSPPLQLTGGMAYRCSYWYAAGESYVSVNYGLYYGTSQSASAMTAMRPDITGQNSTTYQQIVGSFTAPTTGVYYLGVKVNHTKYGVYGAAIDDIGVEQLPLCAAKPTAGTISASPTLICSSGTTTLSLVGTSMASKLNFQWQDSTASGWNNVSTGSGGTTTTYTSATLTSARKYRCIVTCPLISTPNADTTPVYLMNVGAIIPPYIETFESGTEGVNMPCASYTSSWSAGYMWYLYGSPFDSYYSAIDNHTPGGSKYLYAGYALGYYTGANQYWFSPAIKFTAGDTYEFSYWYNGSDYSGGSTNLGMYYGTSQSASSMIAIRSDLSGVNTASYKQLIGRFVSPGTGNYYLGIKVQHTAFTYPGVVIDDIGLVQLPPCTGAPTVGAISAAPSMLCSAGGTVKLDMDMASVSKVSGLSYRWEYTFTDPSSGFVAAGSSAALTAALYTSTSLPSTAWFRCIVKCTATGDSTISSVLKVDVGVIVPPYIETFESGTPGTNMPCASYTYAFGAYYYWNVMGSPLTYGSSALDNHTPGGAKFLIGGYYLGYYSGSPEYWFTPAIKFTAGKLYQLSYWHKSDAYSGATYTIDAYLGASQSAAAMTTAIGSSVTPTGTYKQFKNQFTAASTGNLYIGFKKSQSGFGYGIAIDDIGLQEVPPCSAPVVAGTIVADPIHVCASGGTTLLDLVGSTLATGLTYQWLYATSPSGPFVATGGTTLPYNTDPIVVTTWYKVVVKCTATGATDTSAALKVGVGAFDLPYKEDFETTPAGGVPLCSDATKWGPYYWDGWLVQGSTITGNYKNHTPGGKNFLIGGYELGSPSSISEDNYWFTPALNFRAGYKYNLSFYHVCKVSWSTTGSKMGVYYGKSQTATGMTTNLIPYKEFTNTAYQLYDTTFVMPTGGIYYFGFRKSGANPSSDWSYYGAAFDDINLNYAPCDGPPNAGIITSMKPSGTQYCLGTPITLINSGSTISLVPGIKYQWQRRSIGFPSVWTNIAGAKDTTITADTLIGFEYRMAVVCANTNDTTYSPSFMVPQYPPHPAVTISPSATPITFCLGDSVRFTASNFVGALYDWMKDSVLIPGWKFNDLGATEGGTYMVKVSSALSPCPAYSNQVKMIVNDPGYSVTITKPADSIICAGTSLNLSAFASKSGVTYQWRKDNIVIPGATSSTLLVTTTGYYRATAYDGVSTCPAVSRNILITVKPNPPAVITIPGGTTTACENEGVKLKANNGKFSYEWTRGGSTIVGWTDSNQTIKNSGVYSVKVRSADGCVSVSAAVTVNILPSPTPLISKSGLTLSTTSVYTGYQWIRNGVDMPDVPVGSATSSTLNLTKNGIYKVRVRDGNGCEGVSNPIEILENGLSISNTSLQNEQIRIYPNPTNGKVFIESSIMLNIEVKDVTGKTILSAKDAKEIDLSKFADGVYLFVISDKDHLIKQQRVTKMTK
jgi:hypothetical protein